jgi:hypothetical protein
MRRKPPADMDDEVDALVARLNPSRNHRDQCPDMGREISTEVKMLIPNTYSMHNCRTCRSAVSQFQASRAVLLFACLLCFRFNTSSSTIHPD